MLAGVVRCWDGLPREGTESATEETFSKQLSIPGEMDRLADAAQRQCWARQPLDGCLLLGEGWDAATETASPWNLQLWGTILGADLSCRN